MTRKGLSHVSPLWVAGLFKCPQQVKALQSLAVGAGVLRSIPTGRF